MTVCIVASSLPEIFAVFTAGSTKQDPRVLGDRFCQRIGAATQSQPIRDKTFSFTKPSIPNVDAKNKNYLADFKKNVRKPNLEAVGKAEVKKHKELMGE